MPQMQTLHARPLTQSLRTARENVTLLLVDDDRLIRKVLQAVLHFEGYRVITASNGPEAMKIAARTAFDMLVTDFQMPEMDGYTLAKRLTQQRPILPVLMISGAASADLPLFDLRREKWGFLPKPVDTVEMLRMIDRDCLGWAVRR